MGLDEAIKEILLQEARLEGQAIGKKRGIEQGIEQGKLSFVQVLVRETDFDDEKIGALAGVEISLVKKMRTKDQRIRV